MGSETGILGIDLTLTQQSPRTSNRLSEKSHDSAQKLPNRKKLAFHPNINFRRCPHSKSSLSKSFFVFKRFQTFFSLEKIPSDYIHIYLIAFASLSS
jgi:hypothetical protein